MATRWSDPPIMFMLMIPFIFGFIGLTIYLPLKTGLIFTSLIPYFVTYVLWNFIYHAPEPAETEKFITFNDAKLKRTYANRKIPMCELYELFIDGQIDFKGDVFQVSESLIMIFVSLAILIKFNSYNNVRVIEGFR